MDGPSKYKKLWEQPDNLPITHSWLFKGIQSEILDLHVDDIDKSPQDVVSRRRVEVVTEYTWIQITKGQREANVLFPALYVPGQPRIWRGIITPSAPLNASSEPPAIIDEHLQRQKAFPYEPTFKAIHTLQQLAAPTNPTTNFRTVDIVSDAETLATFFTFLNDPDPTRRAPFRLELSTVRHTLFLSTATHRGRGHTHKDGRANSSIPGWVAPALTRLGTGGHATGPLFHSGNHFRVVRYRLGALVVVVRVKVDFALEHCKPLQRTENPPFRGCQYERYHHLNTADGKGDERVLGFQTLVKSGEGRGTRPGAAGITSVRLAGSDRATVMAAKMPLLWFGRIPLVLDSVVSRKFEVIETKLLGARESYTSWEKKHQNGLKLMAGLLRQLQWLTRAARGNCVAIADPGQKCFRIRRPFLNRSPMPESLVLAVWGPDEKLAVGLSTSSTESDDGDEDDSTLSQLSGTPSGFSNWKLEENKMPDVSIPARCREVVDSRRAVEDWLDNDDSEQHSPGHAKYPINKKELRARTRNPALPNNRAGGSRHGAPLGSSIMDGLDGAADFDSDSDSDNDVDDDDDNDDEAADRGMGGTIGHMNTQFIELEDEDDHTEESVMDGVSQTDTASMPSLQSSQDDSSSQNVSMADDDNYDYENEDEDDDDLPIPFTEVEHLFP